MRGYEQFQCFLVSFFSLGSISFQVLLLLSAMAMTVSSRKSISSGTVSLPRSLSVIILSVGGLALVLVLASLLLVSNPIAPSLQEYLFRVDRYRKPASAFGSENQTGDNFLSLEPVANGKVDMVIKEPSSESEVPNSLAGVAHDGVAEMQGDSSVITNSTAWATQDGMIEMGDGSSSDIRNATQVMGNSDSSYGKSSPGSCDLYHGKWIYDYMGPLYTNSSCPVITQTQNCQGNGRPDKDYENWRWKPEHCNLPRFDARKFLELMRGKTLAFIGDSVARNQMESILCILWQVEAPKNRGNRRMQRWYFRSTSTFIVRIWSSWLVHRSPEPFWPVPDKVDKLHLDLPDKTFMEFLPKFDVVVLSSGHWFAKQSAYILNGTLVGGQLWWPKEAGKMQVNNIQAFGISVETCLTAIASHLNFSGLAIVRSYSPDHYEGGAWNTGGSCTGKVRPVTELVRNRFTDVMHEKQVTGFNRAMEKARSNGPKVILMDITEPFGYRPDGHPGPYRSPDPNKVTRRGPNGEPPPQDCLHWCMPGPVDTWNEILLEIIRREFEQT